MPSAHEMWVYTMLTGACFALLFVEIALLRALTGWSSAACLQLHLASFAAFACFADLSLAQLLAFLIAWPALGPVLASSWIGQFAAFLTLPIATGAIAAAASGRAFQLFASNRLAWLWPSASGIAFLFMALAAGELVFRHSILTAAQQRGVDCLDAGSLLYALGNAQREEAPGLHARARKGKAIFIWSFSKMDLVAAEEPPYSLSVPRRPLAPFPSCFARL